MPAEPLLLRTGYGQMAALLREFTDTEAGQPSGWAGWAVLDLVQHLVFDARRGLVATATPGQGPADTDAVGYWRSWQQSRREADDDRWPTRVAASDSGGIGARPRCTRDLVRGAGRSVAAGPGLDGAHAGAGAHARGPAVDAGRRDRGALLGDDVRRLPLLS